MEGFCGCTMLHCPRLVSQNLFPETLRLQVIAQESEEADKVKVVVSREEAIASAEAAKVKAIKVRRQALANA